MGGIGKRLWMALLCVGLAALSATPESASFDREVLPVLKNSCLPCHNDHFASGGLMLEEFESAKSLETRREVWERILRRVKNGQMPPGRVKPSGIPEFIDSLERALKAN